MSLPYNFSYDLPEPSISWKKGVPHSESFSDCYYSRENGLEESRYVFLGLNNLPEAWFEKQAFVIAELGFGTGLNFLLTCQEWKKTRQATGRLTYITFEQYPLSKQELSKAHSFFPQVTEESDALLEQYDFLHSGINYFLFKDASICLILVLGAAEDFLPHMNFKANAWYLDGFKPSSNPALWNSSIFKEIARCSSAAATVSSFSSASVVKQGLTEADFKVEKVKGYGKKRESIRAIANFPVESVAKRKPESVAIIGAGLAGCFLAWSLCRRGINVSLFDKNPEIAGGASGNLVAMAKPDFSAEPDRRTEFSLAGFALLRRICSLLDLPPNSHEFKGIFRSPEYSRLSNFYNRLGNEYNLETWMDKYPHSAGFENYKSLKDKEGIVYKNAGWIKPRELCQALLNDTGGRLSLHLNSEITSIASCGSIKLRNSDTNYKNFTQIVLANSIDCQNLLNKSIQGFSYNYGSVYQFDCPDEARPTMPLVGPGYAINLEDSTLYLGATYEHDNSCETRTNSQAKLQKAMADFLKFDELASHNPISSRRSVRCNSRDRMPVLGRWPEWQGDTELYLLTGLGSKGLTYAPLAAEITVALILNEGLPVTDFSYAGLKVDRLLRE